MATGYKICKVCGKKYEYCMTNRRADIFRWQDVSCSPECGAIYFARIAASRSGDTKTGATENIADTAIELDDDEDFDTLFEEEFEDGDEEIDIEE